MFRSIVSVSLGIAVLTLACAQRAYAQPTPEQKKLEYFVGKWKIDTDVKASDDGPANKTSGIEDCEWFANLHVVCKADSTTAAGNYRTMRIISWVPALKVYSQYAVDSYGFALLSTGQVSGNTWTFTTTLPGGKMRSTMKTSGDGYTTISGLVGADGKFSPAGTGKAVRMK